MIQAGSFTLLRIFQRLFCWSRTSQGKKCLVRFLSLWRSFFFPNTTA